MTDFNTENPESVNSIAPAYIKMPDGTLTHFFMTQYSAKHRVALLGSPSEKGIMELDNKVIQPKIITARGLMKYQSFEDLNKLYETLRKKIIKEIVIKFYCKSKKVCSNMLLQELEELGTNDKIDAIEVVITMQEFLAHGK